MKTLALIITLVLASTSLMAQSLPVDTSNFQYLRNRIKDQTLYIQGDPTNPVFYIGRGYYKVQMHDYKGCIEDETTAIRLDPERSEAHFHLGVVLDRLRKP